MGEHGVAVKGRLSVDEDGIAVAEMTVYEFGGGSAAEGVG